MLIFVANPKILSQFLCAPISLLSQLTETARPHFLAVRIERIDVGWSTVPVPTKECTLPRNEENSELPLPEEYLDVDYLRYYIQDQGRKEDSTVHGWNSD